MILKSTLYILCFFLLAFPTLYVSKHISIGKFMPTSHEENIKKQLDRLQKTHNSKMIIIGGSGCGFGLNSPLLEEYFNLPVYNTGTHAGIGLLTLTELFKNYISPGDIICLIPEYSHFFDNFYLGEGALVRQALYLPIVREKLTFKQTVHIIKYLPEATWTCDEDSPYHVSSLNDQGDICKYRIHDSTLSLSAAKHIIGKKLQPAALRITSNFINYCERKGAKVLFLPPAIDSIAFAANKEKIANLSAYLEEYGIPYFSRPQRYALNDTLFFDSPYHLTNIGATIRTELLVEDIKEYLFREGSKTNN